MPHPISPSSSTPLVVLCPSCEARYRVGRDAIGRTLSCKSCGAAIRVGAPTPSMADPAPPQGLQSAHLATPHPRVGKSSFERKRHQAASSKHGVTLLIALGISVALTAACAWILSFA